MREIRYSILCLGIALLATGAVSAQSSRAIESKILVHLRNIAKHSLRGPAGDLTALENENAELARLIRTHGERRDVLRYRFPRLVGKMTIATSPDRRFRIYSWDNETGGTRRDHENIFQFQTTAGRVQTLQRSQVREGDANGLYHQVFQIDSTGGRLYLANSALPVSSSLIREDLSVFRIERSGLDLDVRIIRTPSGLRNSVGFNYDLLSVSDRSERPVRLFHFDPAARSFRFPVVIRDRRTPQGRVTGRWITYRFNGSEFVKMG